MNCSAQAALMASTPLSVTSWVGGCGTGRRPGTARPWSAVPPGERGPPDSVIQLLQVLTVAIGAPAVTGVIAKVKGSARLQGRRGPRVIQPYYDLAKLARKEALAPRTRELVLPGGAADRGRGA